MDLFRDRGDLDHFYGCETCFFARKRYVLAPEHFQMMGWPAEDWNSAELEGMAGNWRNFTET